MNSKFPKIFSWTPLCLVSGFLASVPTDFEPFSCDLYSKLLNGGCIGGVIEEDTRSLEYSLCRSLHDFKHMLSFQMDSDLEGSSFSVDLH